ncbi:MAG: peptidylprolyl isomerase [Planctomycetota bacterium]
MIRLVPKLSWPAWPKRPSTSSAFVAPQPCEPLEPRMLFSAAVTDTIGEHKAVEGEDIPAIVLSDFFDDDRFTNGRSIVKAETNQGDIFIETFDDITPDTAQNFLNLVDDGAYNGMFFHRSIPGFVVQGGGFTVSNDGTAVDNISTPTIDNEFANFAAVTGSGATFDPADRTIQLPSGTDLSQVEDDWTLTIIDPGNPDNFIIVGIDEPSADIPVTIDDANDQVVIENFEIIIPSHSGTNADITANSNVVQFPAGTDLSGIASTSVLRVIRPSDGAEAILNPVSIDDDADTITFAGGTFSSDFPGLDWQIVPTTFTADFRLTPPVNVEGTLAMAKLGGDPDSATSQFFFNLVDNNDNLDTQNGGFTTFARVVEGMDVVDAIEAFSTFDIRSEYTENAGALSDVPLTNYTQGDGQPDVSDFALVEQMTQVEELTYNVTGNTNPDLATVAVSDQGELVFTPGSLASGTSDITVTATDVDGNTVEQTFTLTVGLPEFTIETKGKTLKEKRGKSKFNVIRSGLGTAEATINLKFAGKAKFKKDYTVKAKGASLKGKKLTFPAGTTTARLTVQSKDDRRAERTEKFEIIVNAFDNLPLSLGQQVKAKFKIKDDD